MNALFLLPELPLGALNAAHARTLNAAILAPPPHAALTAPRYLVTGTGTVAVPAVAVGHPVRGLLQAGRPKRLVHEVAESVCLICWNSTAKHDANGTRTPRSTPTASKCSHCNLDWVEVLVYKSLAAENRYVYVRPPPANMTPTTKLALCKDRKVGQSCPKPSFCTFAHTEEELAEWSRYRCPRRAPAPASQLHLGVIRYYN